MDARGSSTLERERWSGNAGVASSNVHRGWMRETQFGEQEGSAWFNLRGWLVAHGLWAESATSRKLSGGKGQRVVISTQQTCHAAADQYTRGPSGYEHLGSTTPNCPRTPRKRNFKLRNRLLRAGVSLAWGINDPCGTECLYADTPEGPDCKIYATNPPIIRLK